MYDEALGLDSAVNRGQMPTAVFESYKFLAVVGSDTGGQVCANF